MAFYLVYLMAVHAGNATAEERFELQIPSKPAAEAVKSLAYQTGRSVLFQAADVDTVTANAISGRYSVQQALDALLEGTDLSGGLTNSGVITISRVDSSDSQGEVMLTQNNNKTSAKRRGLLGVLAVVFSAGASAQESSNALQSESEAVPLEEIVVTGTNIRGVDNVGATSISFSREELDSTGFSTLEQVFESLPQNLDDINIEGLSAEGASTIASSNSQLATGINLRGLGPQSTLVLLNGKRRPANVNGRVVDISAIPLSMIERVEIVTGGRSAVYGSDAVAGVVNIVTRTSFDGAETQVYYGETSAGGEQFKFGQTFGREFDRGGFVLGYDYRQDKELALSDTGAVLASSRIGFTPVPDLYYVLFPSEQHIGLLAAHYELSDTMELYADIHVSSDENEGGRLFNCCDGAFDLGGTFVTDSLQYSALGGVRFGIGEDWQLDLSGLYGVVDNELESASMFSPAGTFTSFDVEPTGVFASEAALTSFSAIADGILGRLLGELVSAAIGIELRNESFERKRTDVGTGVVTPSPDLDRDVFSVFAEAHVPLLQHDGQRLEVSLAGRYDDYSDFGDTFNPQLGLEWEPIAGLSFRGSFAQAFRAPDMETLAGDNFGAIQLVDDPMAPGTTVALFSVTDGNPDLQPEEADTWTIGIDWEPTDQAKISISYFNIDYENRLDRPTQNVAEGFQNESLFPGLITRNPTLEQLGIVINATGGELSNITGIPFNPAVDDPFAVFTNIVLFDNRVNNIGLEAVDGIDLQASLDLETDLGDWLLSLNGTKYLDFTRNLTVTSPPIEQINRPGKPVDLKLRGRIGWSQSAWNVSAYVNYVDSYVDDIAATPTKIDSWTTVDLTVRYDASEHSQSGFLNGLDVTLGINNAFDEDPPFFGSNFIGLAYDGVNSNPVGRFVSLRLVKRW